MVLVPGTVTAVDPTQEAIGELTVSITPNPLYANGKLTFRTSRPGFLRAVLFDMSGRRVRTLRPGAAPAGVHELLIDGRDELGRPLASGVYFFKVETSEGSRVGRAIMLK
jgi:hypothetical protein